MMGILSLWPDELLLESWGSVSECSRRKEFGEGKPRMLLYGDEWTVTLRFGVSGEDGESWYIISSPTNVWSSSGDDEYTDFSSAIFLKVTGERRQPVSGGVDMVVLVRPLCLYFSMRSSSVDGDTNGDCDGDGLGTLILVGRWGDLERLIRYAR